MNNFAAQVLGPMSFNQRTTEAPLSAGPRPQLVHQHSHASSRDGGAYTASHDGWLIVFGPSGIPCPRTEDKTISARIEEKLRRSHSGGDRWRRYQPFGRAVALSQCVPPHTRK